MSEAQLIASVCNTLDALLAHIVSNKQIPTSITQKHAQLVGMDIHKALRSFMVVVENVYTQRIFSDLCTSFDSQVILWQRVIYKSIDTYRGLIKRPQSADDKQLGSHFLRLCKHCITFYRLFISTLAKRVQVPNYVLKVLRKLDIEVPDCDVPDKASYPEINTRSIVFGLSCLADISRYRWEYQQKVPSASKDSGIKSCNNTRRYLNAALTIDQEDYAAHMKIGTYYLMRKQHLPAFFHMANSVYLLIEQRNVNAKNQVRMDGCMSNLAKLLDKILSTAPTHKSPDHGSVTVFRLLKMYAEIIRPWLSNSTNSSLDCMASPSSTASEDIGKELAKLIVTNQIEPNDVCMLLLLGLLCSKILGFRSGSFEDINPVMQLTYLWCDEALVSNIQKALFRKNASGAAAIMAPLRVLYSIVRLTSRFPPDAYLLNNLCSALTVVSNTYGINMEQFHNSYREMALVEQLNNGWIKLAEERLMMCIPGLCLRPMHLSDLELSSTNTTKYRAHCIFFDGLLTKSSEVPLFDFEFSKEPLAVRFSAPISSQTSSLYDKSRISDTTLASSAQDGQQEEEIVLFRPRGLN